MHIKRLILPFALFITTISLGQGSLELYTPESYFYRGIENIEKSNYATARTNFRNFLKTAPYDERTPLAEYFIAFSSINLYNLNAEEDFTAFVEKYPTHPRALTAYYELGKFYYRDKNYTKAIEYFEKTDFGQLTNTQQSEVRFKLAYAYFNKRSFDKALTNFNILKRKKGKYTDISKYYAGYIEYEREEYDKALTDLKDASRNETYAPLIPSLISNIYYKQERYDELIEYANEVSKTKISSSNLKNVYLLTAEAYFKKEDYENSLYYFKEFESKAGNNFLPEYGLRIAICEFNLGNKTEAVKYLQKIAPRKDELGAVASFYLGWLYIQDNDIESAAAAFQIASTTVDNFEIKEQAEFQYGKLSLELGRYRETINKLEQFKTSFPDSKMIAEANDLLSQAYVETSDYDLAIKHIESLPNMTTNIRRAYQKATLLKANQLFNQGKYRESIPYYDKSLNHALDNALVIQANYWKSEALSTGNKYSEAVTGYQYVIGARDPVYEWRARYGLGYAYYNQANYSSAQTQFKYFVDGYKGEFKKLYEDAVLRLADCYYVMKDYASAQQLYRKAIRENRRGLDYAYLHSGIVYSLQGDKPKAVNQFETVLEKYPNSQYKDEALFELASLNFESGNYAQSIDVFTALINEVPLSGYVPYAYQRRGISHFNLGTFGRTIEDYKTFLRKFPDHPEARDILVSLQEVMSSQDRSEEFETVLAEYKAANPEESNFEVVEFETAKGYYNSQNYNKAIQALSAFISEYPQDFRVYEANFYIAESYYRLEDFQKALETYYQILRDDQISRVSRVISRVAEIEYNYARFDNALKYYHELRKVAKNKRETYTAFAGLMKTHYQKLNPDSVIFYASEIEEKADLNVNALNLALLYKGKAAYYRGDFDGAIELFNSTVNNAKDISGAEAQYLIGDILHQKQDFKGSNEVLFEMPANFPVFEEWVGKSFLLIADNYIELEEYLQARATLNSIIENTTSGTLANLAKNKLEVLDNIELDDTPLDTLQVADTINLDNN